MSVGEKDALVGEVEARVLAIGARRGEFDSVYARTGNPETVNEEAEDIIGTIQLEFVEWDQRRPANEILDEILAASEDLAGITVEPRKEEAGPPIGVTVSDTSLAPSFAGGTSSESSQSAGGRGSRPSMMSLTCSWSIVSYFMSAFAMTCSFFSCSFRMPSARW